MITIKVIAPLRRRRNNKIIAENSAISTKRLSRMTILVTMIIARAKARGGTFAEKWHEKCDITRNEPLSLGKICIKCMLDMFLQPLILTSERAALGLDMQTGRTGYEQSLRFDRTNYGNHSGS